MKKISAILSLMILVMFLVGCGSSNDSVKVNDLDEGYCDEETGICYFDLDETQDTNVTTEVVAEETTEEVATTTEETTEEATEEVVAAAETVETTTTSDYFKTFYVNEGELVKVNIKATNPELTTLTYYFTSPLNASGEWMTEVGDAGTYIANVIASNGKINTTKEIKIVVKSLNNAPVISEMDAITVDEGETVTLDIKATDADGDNVTFAISGWMTSETKVTDFNDEGSHKVTIKASDGKGGIDYLDIYVTVVDVPQAPVIDDIVLE